MMVMGWEEEEEEGEEEEEEKEKERERKRKRKADIFGFRRQERKSFFSFIEKKFPKYLY